MNVSILILTKNEKANIANCLDAVYSQKTARRVEVIVVDSGSTDGTPDIARRYPVRFVEIAPEEFHHARTRNYAASLAAEKCLVYLAADALPSSDEWLEALVSHFDDPLVAAVYGRQLPKEKATGERWATLSKVYPEQPIVKERGRKRQLGYVYYHFSTVNAALRRDVWEAVRFPEELKVFEDVGIAKKILDSSLRIVYEPKALVLHSHNHTASGLFKRYFDGGVIWRELGLWDRDIRASMVRDAMRLLFDGSTKSKRNGHAGPRQILPLASKTIGFTLGLYNFLLPRAVKRKMSAFGVFE